MLGSWGLRRSRWWWLRVAVASSGSGTGEAATSVVVEAGGAGINTDSSTAGAGGSHPDAHRSQYTGELVPVDSHVMLDRSGSMQDAGKWGAVTQAFPTS